MIDDFLSCAQRGATEFDILRDLMIKDWKIILGEFDMLKTAKKVFGAGLGAAAFTVAAVAWVVNGVANSFEDNPEGYDDPLSVKKYVYDFKQIGEGLTLGYYDPIDGITVENTLNNTADGAIKALDVVDGVVEHAPDVIDRLNDAVNEKLNKWTETTDYNLNSGSSTVEFNTSSNPMSCENVDVFISCPATCMEDPGPSIVDSDNCPL